MSDTDSAAGSPARHLHDEQDDYHHEDVTRRSDEDKDSDALSEIDEDQFDDYDPATARIDEKRPEPKVIDEDAARTLKASKRKGTATRKPKEGRREKKRARDRDDDGADGEILHTKRVRKATGGDDKQPSPEPEKEENLTPEERRRRAIERAATNQSKSKSTRRKKKDEVDLEEELDERIADLKVRMENACQADNQAREASQPALHKLKLLPEVMSLLNRNNNQAAVVDPDTNFLQHVKFFLEPLNDGSLPAYNIQRDIFQALTHLPIEKETLRSSGIGKVVLFYTKSKKPEVGIKRMAERLLGEWSRPILKRTDDYKKRRIETRDFDYEAAKLRQVTGASSQLTLNQRVLQSSQDAERQRILAPANPVSAARITSMPSTYTIAPRSTFDPSRAPDYRPIGAGGMDAFRRIAQKGKKKG
ncbi:Transcription factor iws1 [Parahypoxylon ruwenzoriense]